MKNLFLTTMVVGAVLFTSCEKDLSEDTTEPTIATDNPTEISSDLPEQKVLATIQKNGHEFQFLEVGNEGSVLVGQKVYDQSTDSDPLSHLLDQEGSTPFDLFVALTDHKVGIPHAIAATAEANTLLRSTRHVIENATPILIEEDSFNSFTKACYDEGFNGFRNKRCGVVIPSTANDIRFCDNGTWTTHIRNSVFGGVWRKLDDTTTWTNVICGEVVMQFFGNNVLESQVVLPNGIWKWNYYTSKNKKRSVKRYRTGSTGSFRAYTRFF